MNINSTSYDAIDFYKPNFLKWQFNEKNYDQNDDSIDISNINPMQFKAGVGFSNDTTSYDDIVINLNAEQLRGIEIAMEQLEDQDTDDYLEALRSNTLLESEIFKKEHFSLVALKAIKAAKINSLTFSTSILFFNAIKKLNMERREVRIISLFYNDQIDLVAKLYIENSLNSDEFSLNAVQKRRFFELMRNLPFLEQQILVFKKPRTQFTDTLEQALIRSKFDIFSRLECLDNYGITISKGAMQAFIYAKYGNEGVNMISRLQLSPFMLLKLEIKKNERDFCLNFSHLPFPVAHGYTSEDGINSVEMHDFYHACVNSAIPFEARFTFLEYGKYFESVKCSDIANRIYDMEHTLFVIKNDENRSLDDMIVKSIAIQILILNAK